jgi:hypothetical protein
MGEYNGVGNKNPTATEESTVNMRYNFLPANFGFVTHSFGILNNNLNMPLSACCSCSAEPSPLP